MEDEDSDDIKSVVETTAERAKRIKEQAALVVSKTLLKEQAAASSNK